MTSLSLVVKGIKSERKTKRKKKGVRIQAILGRIRTPDPDPGHFGPDFDSGSELESAFADPSPCASLTLSPTALGPIGPRVFKGIQLKA
jgi:hypothetical protein